MTTHRTWLAAAAALSLGWPAAALAERPVLEAQQGRYFGWAAPRGWRASESTNGVSLRSPDGAQRAGFVMLLRSQGTASPRGFLTWMLSLDPTLRLQEVVGERRLPDVPGGPAGGVWQMAELEVRLLVEGAPHRGTFTCSVKNAWGLNDAMCSYAHAAAAQWAAGREWLPQLARSVRITNMAQVAGNDQLLRPRNNPLDNSGLLESWRKRGLSEDRISQARREGTMGYERMKDPSTGRTYDMPLETWDGAAGGYRNPARPGELLVKP